MNIGPTEVAILLLFLAIPIYAAVRAFRRGYNGWGVGILIGMFIPFAGVILAVVYLGQRRSPA